ncbi:MAG: hypothetical protein ACRD5L_18710, partial [Bryobacteraceae bacterium]
MYLTRWARGYRFFSDWCDWFAGSSNEFRGWKLAHRVDGYFEERIRRCAERVSVTSQVLWQRAMRMGLPEARVAHIPEGAATDYIVPLPTQPAREKAKLPLSVPIVLAVRNGNMCREVRIFRELLRRVPGALFVMVGSASHPAV